MALKYALSLAISLALLFLAFRQTDFGQLWQILAATNNFWVLLAIPCLFLSHLVRAWRWQVFLLPMKKTALRNCWSALMIGYMANNILPRAGEIVRPLSIGKLEGISRSASLGTVLLERIIDIAIMLVLLIALFIVSRGSLDAALPEIVILDLRLSIAHIVAILSVLGVLGVGILGVLLFNRSLGDSILAWISRMLSPRLRERGGHIISSLLDGFLGLRDREHYLLNAVLSLTVWLLYAFMMYFPLLAFPHMPPTAQTFPAAVVVLAISTIGLLLPVPGGIGAYHYFVILTLHHVYDVPNEVAVGYAVITHAAAYLSLTTVGLVYFLKDHILFKELLEPEAFRS